MSLLIRVLVTSVPLIALPALAAAPGRLTGLGDVGPAAFFFTVAAALFLTLIFRSTATHIVGLVSSWLGTIRIRRVLDRRSANVLHDFILPGAYGGLTRVDHAILTAGGILCIQTKHYNGIVFGGEEEAQWTNVDGTRNRRFLNPLIQNAGRTRALQNVVPDIPVANLVVFTGSVDFPAPPPKNVIPVAQLDTYIAKFVFGPSKVKDWDAAWLTLKSAALTDEASRKDLRAQIA
ncbi:MAG: NERD domain-containing protein [Gammaproteobacteria bacterium]|nr:NERD domain-containing protein [Gammaproteobacteria bacterium]MDH5305046.1 NERD domain-containing protein [Gammaproteobacteria bacterium]MDH5322842.1 NERD domain-containing protein [Gammaproteobacteria bacterium]